MKRKLYQPPLQSQTWGGVRSRAGRKKIKNRGASHQKRAQVTANFPLHVTVRLKSGLKTLRSKAGFKMFREALKKAQCKGARVIHFALLGNHYHLLIEAKDNETLARTIKSLNGSVAKKLLSGSRGQVIEDRYHLQILKTPTQVRNTLVYIFTNAAKHYRLKKAFDWFSSFAVFNQTELLKNFRLDLDWSLPQIPEEILAY